MKCDFFFGKLVGDCNINNVDDLVMYLFEVGYVVCVGGILFGFFECICMSYVIFDENIIEVMCCIKEVLVLLK